MGKEEGGLAGKIGVCTLLSGIMSAHNIRYVQLIGRTGVHKAETFQNGPTEHADELFLVYFLVVTEIFSIIPGGRGAEPNRIPGRVPYMIESAAVFADEGS